MVPLGTVIPVVIGVPSDRNALFTIAGASVTTVGPNSELLPPASVATAVIGSPTASVTVARFDWARPSLAR